MMNDELRNAKNIISLVPKLQFSLAPKRQFRNEKRTSFHRAFHSSFIIYHSSFFLCRLFRRCLTCGGGCRIRRVPHERFSAENPAEREFPALQERTAYWAA